jgi:hypothetical protein
MVGFYISCVEPPSSVIMLFVVVVVVVVVDYNDGYVNNLLR